MILSVLLSATLTFTATATGVEKGTTIEFFLSGQNTDRAYESMFVLDEPVEVFCKRLESVVPRGTPVNVTSCRLWPTGCRVRFEPSFDRFVKIEQFEGERVPTAIYTGGTRRNDGTLEVSDTMPAAVFSTYSLPQSPFVYDVPIDQGSSYGRFTATVTLEKGKRFTFTMTADEFSLPKKLELTAEKGKLKDLLAALQKAAATGDVDATVVFSDKLTVEEAVAVSRALSVIDSPRVKINGACGLFYRAFLPLEKWRDRQERLHQPFELTLNDDGSDELLFIDEDWTVQGNDPKLTPQKISVKQAARHTDTDSCFVYASRTQSLARITRSMNELRTAHIVNWYVFPKE